MSFRRIGWCFVLCMLALVSALVAAARAEPIRLATLTRPVDAASDRALLDSALDCLALNIYWEARAEPRLGQIAIAEVTLNRVADPAFPDTVCGVVRQGAERGLNSCQFSWYCDGQDDRPRNPSAWQHARRLALLALSGRLPDPTNGALWFHSDQVHPDWPELTPIVKIGSHIFYRTATSEGPAVDRRRDFPPLPPVEKPAPPVWMAASDVIPALAPSRPGPSDDPARAIGRSGGCNQDLMDLAGASEAEYLAVVERMRREPADRRASCAGRSGDERALALAPGFAPRTAVQGNRLGRRLQPTLQDRISPPLTEPGRLPRLIRSAGRPHGAPPALDRMPASSF